MFFNTCWISTDPGVGNFGPGELGSKPEKPLSNPEDIDQRVQVFD